MLDGGIWKKAVAAGGKETLLCAAQLGYDVSQQDGMNPLTRWQSERRKQP